ncbi:EamA family transporter [Kribbella sp. NPDC004875]|uniref:EamA family transporter n=1 Tax=Kribbella sp. NPDC004875 TaxID=3364107 RepID=UPI0036AC6DB4
MHHRSSTGRALVHVVLAGLTWGTGGPTGALLHQYADLTPLAVSFWRLAAAAAWLALAHFATRQAFTSVSTLVRVLPRYLLSGVGLAVCQIGYFAAIPRIGVGLATVIALGAGPIFITLASRERLTLPIVVAVAGLALLTITPGATADLAGVAAALLSAAGYSATTLANRDTANPLTSALLGFTVGATLLLPFAALPSTAAGWLLIAYFGLVPTALAYTLFYTALKTLKPSTASVIALLEPVVATAIGIVAFHDHLTAVAALGAAVLLAAAAAQSRRT